MAPIDKITVRFESNDGAILLDPTRISHDEATVVAYTQSERVHSRVSARWFALCMSEIESVGGTADRIKTPVLMQVAGDDHLVSTPASLVYFDALMVVDKTLCHYEHLYHEIYNEKLPDRMQVLDDLKPWVADRYL